MILHHHHHLDDVHDRLKHQLLHPEDHQGGHVGVHHDGGLMEAPGLLVNLWNNVFFFGFIMMYIMLVISEVIIVFIMVVILES